MNDQIELRHLRYFLEVAEKLHFTQAALALRVAQPALSQQIRRLEEMMGHRLFERTTRGVRLTSAGAALQERARGAIQRLEHDLEEVRRIGRGEAGTLTIGFSGSVMFTQLPAAIRSFREKYPQVELKLREMFTATQVAAIADGEIDLGFMRDADPHQAVVTTVLLREHFVGVLPEHHALTKRRTVRIADLAKEPFVLFSRSMGPTAYDRTIACCEREGFTPRIVQETPQFSSLMRLVAAGLGVSLAPECLANIHFPGAVCKPLDVGNFSQIDVGVKVGSANPLAKNFIAEARRFVRSTASTAH